MVLVGLGEKGEGAGSRQSRGRREPSGGGNPAVGPGPSAPRLHPLRCGGGQPSRQVGPCPRLPWLTGQVSADGLSWRERGESCGGPLLGGGEVVASQCWRLPAPGGRT